jgi:alkylation response protein AidB-like acyl-CoA dehydrogenase
MIVETAHRVFRDACDMETVAQAAKGTWPKTLWQALAGNGFTTLDDDGLTWEDALALLHVAGYYAVPVPLAESILASRLLTAAGLSIPEGVLTVGVTPASKPQVEHTASGTRLSGRWTQVAWARQADHVVFLAFDGDQPVITCVDQSSIQVTSGTNLAGEPRDTVVLEGALTGDVGGLPSPWSQDSVRSFAALTRVMLSAGALERILDMTLQYAGERKQFGRPIGKFQAVQAQIAEMATEVAAVRAIANLALAETEASNDTASSTEGAALGRAEWTIALGKVRLAQAIHVSTTHAHQVHGAMGFTEEYPMHHLTRRLWAWRQEFGNDTAWAPSVVTELREHGVWRAVTGV